MSTTAPPETTAIIDLINERRKVVEATMTDLRARVNNLTSQLHKAQAEFHNLLSARHALTQPTNAPGPQESPAPSSPIYPSPYPPPSYPYPVRPDRAQPVPTTQLSPPPLNPEQAELLAKLVEQGPAYPPLHPYPMPPRYTSPAETETEAWH